MNFFYSPQINIHCHPTEGGIVLIHGNCDVMFRVHKNQNQMGIVLISIVIAGWYSLIMNTKKLRVSLQAGQYNLDWIE